MMQWLCATNNYCSKPKQKKTNKNLVDDVSDVIVNDFILTCSYFRDFVMVKLARRFHL